MKPEFINPLTLAYLGDAVFEVYVREYLIVEKNILKPDPLAKEAINYVSAKAHASFMHEALANNLLSEEEIAIYKRGRNAKVKRHNKNFNVLEHNQSSGFECLIGHLYLEGKQERIQEIFEYFKEFVDK
ncbi:MAG: ribonuclease III [Erysipelotrichaceae bacterium]|nr:ribonuclease III [Erysipelotrichaceae bacterium]